MSQLKKEGPHWVDVYVGARIRAERNAQSLSMEVLGEMIGVSFQQVQKYESGKNRVSTSMLWEIGHALNVPIDRFVPSRMKREEYANKNRRVETE
jgi:transcriptional regulator with XRE-family HTH domain